MNPSDPLPLPERPSSEKPEKVPVPSARTHRSSWRPLTVAARILAATGVLLVPLSVATASLHEPLTDSTAFAQEFAPLAADPQVQDFVTRSVVAAIDERVSVPFLSGAVERGISAFVASAAFETAWAEGLRIGHENTITALRGESGSVVSVADGGSIGFELGPIVANTRSFLVERNVPLAGLIPELQRTIAIGDYESAATAMTVYALLVWAGTWLPWIAVILLACAATLAAFVSRDAIARLAVWSSAGLGCVSLVSIAALSLLRAHLLTVMTEHVPAEPADRALASLVDPVAVTLGGVAFVALLCAGTFILLRRRAAEPPTRTD